MSTFKVSKEIIELFPHSNADSLEIGKVGTRQVVVQKGLYQTGNEVIFAPSKSVLPEGRIKTEFEKYLSGSSKDRIKSVRLRGEISDGIIIPKELIDFDLDDVEIGQDISERLGIKEYMAVIPKELDGTLEQSPIDNLSKHDCEQYSIYISQLQDNQDIIITEKIHGTQVIFAHDIDNNTSIVSSKGRFKQMLVLKEDENNFYWKAVKNSNLIDIVKRNFSSGIIQIFGEGIPVQNGYTYGSNEPKVLIFKVLLNGEKLKYGELPQEIKNLWVPILYQGKISFDEKRFLSKELVDLSTGFELVSGKNLHIREGVVLTTTDLVRAKDGTEMSLKIINPKYKETGEELN